MKSIYLKPVSSTFILIVTISNGSNFKNRHNNVSQIALYII